MEPYRVIPLHVYQSLMAQQKQIDEGKLLINKLNSLPKATNKKATQLLSCLKEVGINYDDEGVVTSARPYFDDPFNVFPYVVFSQTGLLKSKPEKWSEFLDLLAEKKIPKSLLSAKALKHHGKKTKATSRR